MAASATTAAQAQSVEVVKVYDSCFQCECVEDLSVTPATGRPDPSSIQSIVGKVVSFDCQFGESLNIPGCPVAGA